jgi:hypothetical protein
MFKENKVPVPGNKLTYSHEALQHVWYNLSGGQYYLTDPREAEKIGAVVTPSGDLYNSSGFNNDTEPAALILNFSKKLSARDTSLW